MNALILPRRVLRLIPLCAYNHYKDWRRADSNFLMVKGPQEVRTMISLVTLEAEVDVEAMDICQSATNC